MRFCTNFTVFSMGIFLLYKNLNWGKVTVENLPKNGEKVLLLRPAQAAASSGAASPSSSKPLLEGLKMASCLNCCCLDSGSYSYCRLSVVRSRTLRELWRDHAAFELVVDSESGPIIDDERGL